MTYEEIIQKVRDGFENADARRIKEHIAVQVNIEGEGNGVFYIEIADRMVMVEPYDYYDRDGIIISDAETIVEIAEGKITMKAAEKSGRIKLKGDSDKLAMLCSLKIKK